MPTTLAGRSAPEARAVSVQFMIGLQVDDLKTSVFKGIWDEPVCELFAPSTDDDFIGECDLDTVTANKQCSSGGFCDGLDEGKQSLVESVIASQIARTVLGFTHGAAGMSTQHTAIAQVRARQRSCQHMQRNCAAHASVSAAARPACATYRLSPFGASQQLQS